MDSRSVTVCDMESESGLGKNKPSTWACSFYLKILLPWSPMVGSSSRNRWAILQESCPDVLTLSTIIYVLGSYLIFPHQPIHKTCKVMLEHTSTSKHKLSVVHNVLGRLASNKLQINHTCCKKLNEHIANILRRI